jgi:hypothetical protein
LQVRVTKDLGVAVSVPSFFVNPRFLIGFLTRGTMGVDGPALDLFCNYAAAINSLG